MERHTICSYVLDLKSQGCKNCKLRWWVHLSGRALCSSPSTSENETLQTHSTDLNTFKKDVEPIEDYRFTEKNTSMSQTSLVPPQLPPRLTLFSLTVQAVATRGILDSHLL